MTPRIKAGDLPPEKTALVGRIAEVLDYGRATFARIAVGNQTVIAPYAGSRGDAVSLLLDQNSLSVVDREAEITIV